LGLGLASKGRGTYMIPLISLTLLIRLIPLILLNSKGIKGIKECKNYTPPSLIPLPDTLASGGLAHV
jgi:hypothetical protein